MKSRVILSFLAILTLGTGSLQAAELFGISLNGHQRGSPGASSLYTVDPVTGAGTLVGTDLGYAVNAIAIDPTTGKMYGSTTTWSGAFNGLLEINPATGTATEIGPFGGGFVSVLGLTFDSTGQLFGWHDPGADDPVTINKMTGAATTLGPGTGTAGQVLAFDPADNLVLVQGSSIYDINTITGVATPNGGLGFDPGSGGAAFNLSSGLLWAARGRGRDVDSWIRVTDIGGNSFTDIDTNISYLNALTWGSVTPVPEPTTLAIWGIGAIGMSFAARRRRKQKSA